MLLTILVTGMGQSLALRVYLRFVIVVFERIIDRTLHSLIQLNIRLGSEYDLTYPRDVMLQ